MSQSQTSSVIRPLENVREKVKQRLMTVPEYRAFLAMQKAIAEVANISDLVTHLQTAQQKTLERLATTKEYQALLTVENAIKDLSQVLEVLDDGNFATEPASADITSLRAAEPQQAIDEIAVAAPIGKTPRVANETAAMTTAIDSQNGAELASDIDAASERPVNTTSKPTEHISTLGLVEEWRRTTMIRESFSANEGTEDALFAAEGSAEAKKAEVA